MIGASPSLVTAVCVLTGMLGANFGKLVLNGMNIKSPCARGVATGVSRVFHLWFGVKGNGPDHSMQFINPTTFQPPNPKP